jgi:rRNA biogenesis protein RRP5
MQVLNNPGNGSGTAHMYALLVPKFAALEFRSPNGDREQGRTLFEGILASFPKRFDIWNQLLDLETSARDPDLAVIRDLFERGTKVKGLKPKQAKAWFRRWAKWEEEKGDAKSRERVSALAQQWAREAAARKGQSVGQGQQKGGDSSEGEEDKE